MYLCYIDESGTPEIPGTTSHYVLVGISIPIWHWHDCDREIAKIKLDNRLENAEIHTAWMMRTYPEQRKIDGFEEMSHFKRREEVSKYRKGELLRLQRENRKQYYQAKKNYRKTDDYIHLTKDERVSIVFDLAKSVGNWGFARLFGECIDKIYYNPNRTGKTPEEQAFEQVVSRFEQYLESIRTENDGPNYALLIHDNNETVSTRHSQLMRKYHRDGTLWTSIRNIIETPLFVDSSLTDMVQVADLCGYALRRYCENGEQDLFQEIFKRADRKSGKVVGLRHFSEPTCTCTICSEHS